MTFSLYSNEYHYIPQAFIQFITLIILSNIKENYSCSGLNDLNVQTTIPAPSHETDLQSMSVMFFKY